MIYIFVVAIAVAGAAWLFWPQVQHWFKDSETIFWARLQMAVGAFWALLLTTPLAPVLAVVPGFDTKWIAAGIALQGAITEIARRSRATDL